VALDSDATGCTHMLFNLNIPTATLRDPQKNMGVGGIKP
jgi:hypothetical protein